MIGAATIVGPLIAGCASPIRDLFWYLMGKKEDIERLQESLTTLVTNLIILKSRKSIIDQLVETSTTKKGSDEFKILRRNIKEIKKRTMKLISKYQDLVEGTHLAGLIGKLDVTSAEDMIKELEERELTILSKNFFKLSKLRRDIDMLNKRAVDVLERINLDYSTKPGYDLETLDEEYCDLPGMKRYADEISRWLWEECAVVGIVGPAGIGKTTVLKMLQSRLMNTVSRPEVNNDLRFDLVISLTYPEGLANKDKIVEALQKEIMERLNINHERTDITIVNESRIAKFLLKKKYVVILDDVSEYIDLKSLGLMRKNHQHGKVVIASRDRKVINQVADIIIEMQQLSTDDAWKLFESIHGEIHNMRIKHIAGRIIECCGKIPLELKLVANHLKGKEDESEWHLVKRDLQSDVTSLDSIGAATLSNIYRSTYEKLGNDIKKCLLYVALFPFGHQITTDYLFECWKAEGFIVEYREPKLRWCRARGKRVLNKLKDEYLLEEWSSLHGKHIKCVRMPQYFRRLATKLKFPGEKNCMIWAPFDGQTTSEEIWRRATRMSLINCKSKIPQNPKCNKYTLLMQGMPELAELSDLFFHNIMGLRVLDLQSTKIRRLPESISKLTDLRSLYLTECVHLDVLPQGFTELKTLELLDISATGLRWLPRVIRYLVSLRCLRVSYSSKGYRHDSKGKNVEGSQMGIRPNIIKNLVKLEELSIEIEAPQEDWESIVDEIASLEHLNTLSFNFPSMKLFDRFVSKSKSLKNTSTSWEEHTFRSFQISVGSLEPPLDIYPLEFLRETNERRLRLSTEEIFSPNSRDILKQTNLVELIGVHSLESLNELDLDEMEVCVIRGCQQLKRIVDGHGLSNAAGGSTRKNATVGVHQNVKMLHMYELPSLQCIWEGPFLYRSLIQLTELTLNGCPSLTKILDLEIASALSNLKHLKVEKCPKISHIIQVPTEESSNEIQQDLSCTLKKLEKIRLSDLPELQSICISTSLEWEALKAIYVEKCHKLRHLSTLIKAKRLVSIECENSWKNKILQDGVDTSFSGRLQDSIMSEATENCPEGEESTSRGAAAGATMTDEITCLEKTGLEESKNVSHSVDSSPVQMSIKITSRKRIKIPPMSIRLDGLIQWLKGGSGRRNRIRGNVG